MKFVKCFLTGAVLLSSVCSSLAAADCHFIKKILKATDYGSHPRVYYDGSYHFPRHLPHQLRVILHAKRPNVLKRMCKLSPDGCQSAFSPTDEFTGLKNILELQPAEGYEMLGEDRGQVYYWSNLYYQKYCQ